MRKRICIMAALMCVACSVEAASWSWTNLGTWASVRTLGNELNTRFRALSAQFATNLTLKAVTADTLVSTANMQASNTLEAARIEGISGFWDGCPWGGAPTGFFAYVEEFLTFPTNSLGNAQGWLITHDGGAALTIGTNRSGVLKLVTDADDNDEVTAQLGAKGTEGTVWITTNSGSKVWFQCRAAGTWSNCSSGMFVGLAAVAAGANFLTDDTMVVGDVNYIGFNIIEASSNYWQAAWKNSGQTAGSQTNVALNTTVNTYHDFGIYFDGVNSIHLYADNVLKHTITNANLATVPNDLALQPTIAIKTSDNTVSATGYVDYVWCVQTR